MLKRFFVDEVREQVIGVNTKVPLLNGEMVPYVNFDNAATTPAFKYVNDKVNEFLKYYSNVHRGSGFKSKFSTGMYDNVREKLTHFLGADLENNTVIFIKNTTEAINLLASSMHLTKDDIVLVPIIEHHSNMLPWSKYSSVKFIGVDEKGRIDIEDYKRKLEKYHPKVKLVAVTGASNVTGYITPIHKMARLAHEHDAEILVDAAQLIAHRPIDMKSNDSPDHIDYLAFSAHKMYAPYGTGGLVASKDVFDGNSPVYPGGGTIKFVSLKDVVWAELPYKEEAGTPNILGAIALAASINVLENIGWKRIVRQEDKLRRYTLKKLQDLDEIQLYGQMDKRIPEHQLGVIPFNIDSMPYSLTSEILGCEGGIGVRSGCFCAQPYVSHLMDYSDKQIDMITEKISNDEFVEKPGLVRISFGCYNTKEEVNRLMDMLGTIIERKNDGDNLYRHYHVDPYTGEYVVRNGFDYGKYFKI